MTKSTQLLRHFFNFSDNQRCYKSKTPFIFKEMNSGVSLIRENAVRWVEFKTLIPKHLNPDLLNWKLLISVVKQLACRTRGTLGINIHKTHFEQHLSLSRSFDSRLGRPIFPAFVYNTIQYNTIKYNII